MKIVRLLSLLLLASPLVARATPALFLSETWQDTLVTNPVTHIVSIVPKGAASFTFSGIVISNVGSINSSTVFYFNMGSIPIQVPLSGNPSDSVNPVFSTYKGGARSATLTFYHNTTDANGTHSALTKTLKLSWANNILSGGITGPSGAFGFEIEVGRAPPPTLVEEGGELFVIKFGNFQGVYQGVSKLNNTVTISGSTTLNTGSYTVASDFIPPTVIITSPRPDFSTTNPVIEATGVFVDNVAIAGPGYRLAAPGDDPSSNWNGPFWKGVHLVKIDEKKGTWSTSVTLTPGTNWFWVHGVDLANNDSPIITRHFFYSTRSPLTLGTDGRGTVTGGRGVTNGAMLEVGRRYTVTGKPKDTNTILSFWRDASFNVLSTQNPWNFLMASNMTIVAELMPNPFPAIVGTYSGLFYDSANPVSPGNSGYLTIIVKHDGSYTGMALFGAQRLPVTGKLQFDSGNFSSTAAIGTGNTVSAHISFPGGLFGRLFPTPSVTMTISNQTFSPLPLQQSSNAVPPGLYNMTDLTLLPPTPAKAIGCSSGSVTVTPTGQANIILHMADGSAPVATFSGPVGADGSVAFFIPLYGGKGLVMGNITISGGLITNSLAMPNYWVKLPNPRERYFPDGFNNAMNWNGLHYTPALGTNFLENLGVIRFDITNRAGDIFADGIFVPSNNSFVRLPGSISTNKFNLKFNPATGLINGSITVNGITIPNINLLVSAPGSSAYGYVLNPHDSAALIISQEAVMSLGQYDDGFVYPDQNFLDQDLLATGYFGFDNLPSQLTYVTISGFSYVQSMLLHKAIQIAPHRQFVITDSFQNMVLLHPGVWLAFPTTSYTGIPDPNVSPAVSVTPTQRTTQYLSN